MLEIEFIELVKNICWQKCESNYFELKAAKKGCLRLFDTFSSFSNQQDGGKIVFGIDENANYEICEVYNAVDLQKNNGAELANGTGHSTALHCCRYWRKTVVCVEIQEIDVFSKPCVYKSAGCLKGSYVRVGDSDGIMSECEVYSFEAFKEKIRTRFAKRNVQKCPIYLRLTLTNILWC